MAVKSGSAVTVYSMKGVLVTITLSHQPAATTIIHRRLQFDFTLSYQHVLQMDKSRLYIKGFKLDDAKIRGCFARQPQDTEPDWEANWYETIIDRIPRTAYIEVSAGVEPNGETFLVIVLDQGYDREKLEETPIYTEDEMLAQAAKHVLTPGIWPSLWP